MKGFKENEDHYIWEFNQGNGKTCLANATLQACDACKKPATVNAVWVVGYANQSTKLEADRLLEEFGELTELGADSEGNAFCEKCYPTHAVLEA